MPATSHLFRKYKRGDTLIETGTDCGAGVMAALAAGYARVISVEVAAGGADWWNSRIIPSVPELTVIKGDSAETLKALVNSDVNWQTATFWLDAHAPGNVPLPRELDVLLPLTDLRGYILIDDMRLIRGGNEWAAGMKESDVTDRLKGWQTEWIDTQYEARDILVAWRA